MRENMKKLALWDTRTFNPIITHDDLDSIMATKGFISHPPYSFATTHLAWKEYVYYAEAVKSNSKPRLPYPRIDGLHIYTYRAFIDAVNFYLEMGDISDLFHVRGMPLHHINDRNSRWVLMQEDAGGFLFTETEHWIKRRRTFTNRISRIAMSQTQW
ncbi:hypothetical protein Patl1_35593 [Pistacia atlantica]|nr:hypothetical protein Patl1_35593 [Pistacia atlantica]